MTTSSRNTFPFPFLFRKVSLACSVSLNILPHLGSVSLAFWFFQLARVGGWKRREGEKERGTVPRCGMGSRSLSWKCQRDHERGNPLVANRVSIVWQQVGVYRLLFDWCCPGADAVEALVVTIRSARGGKWQQERRKAGKKWCVVRWFRACLRGFLNAGHSSNVFSSNAATGYPFVFVRLLENRRCNRKKTKHLSIRISHVPECYLTGALLDQ